jgi:hypothetical protein
MLGNIDKICAKSPLDNPEQSYVWRSCPGEGLNSRLKRTILVNKSILKVSCESGSKMVPLGNDKNSVEGEQVLCMMAEPQRYIQELLGHAAWSDPNALLY